MEATEDDRFARELAEAYETGKSDYYARVLSGRLRQMDKRAKAANVRADQLQASLASERQTATLNAETHTRAIRTLQDMVEAEAEARRETEGENTRLAERLEIKVAALRSEIAAKVTAQQYGVALEDELAGWKRIAVEAAIPLEVIHASKATEAFCPEVREEIAHAIGIIRRAVMGEGLPPAPPPVPSSSKT